MADQTITATSDIQIDSGGNNEGEEHVDVISSGGSRSNGIWRFDVTSLAGKMWDSAHLRLTSRSFHTGVGFPAGFFIARCKRAVVYNQCTSVIFATASNWSAAFGENSTDNDHTTRVDQATILDEVTWSTGDTITFLDISDIVHQGVIDDSGTLDIIMYGTSSGTTVWYSLETVTPTIPATSFPNLFLVNVQDMESTTSSNPGGTASNVAVPSASSLSKSGRPPIAGADRQNSVSILHDGVEPMNILSVTLRGAFGADN